MNSSTNPTRVLVIEDDLAMGEMMQLVLEHQGFSVGAVARTGAEAIAALGRTRFEVAIVDLELPDMDGAILLQELARQVPAMRRVVCSAHPCNSERIATARAVADGVIAKSEFVRIGEVVRTLVRPLREGMP